MLGRIAVKPLRRRFPAWRARAALVDGAGARPLHAPAEIGPHSDRVGAYAVEIYDRWTIEHGPPRGVSLSFRDNLKISARLHDIGKAGIPESILGKRGRLSAEEFEIIKRHVLFGARCFENPRSEWDALSREIALNHHERWDGSGYPGVRDGDSLEAAGFGPGKKGREIPLSARIVAVADVYDALLSDRPYKAPWREDRALGFIRQQSGRHFDPEVVEIFFKIYEVIKAIRTGGEAAILALGAGRSA